jgi:ATP-dependent DNA ligase
LILDTAVFNDSSVRDAHSHPFSFEPMLCQSSECPPEGRKWRYELKLDAFRAISESLDAAHNAGHATRKTSPSDFLAL